MKELKICGFRVLINSGKLWRILLLMLIKLIRLLNKLVEFSLIDQISPMMILGTKRAVILICHKIQMKMLLMNKENRIRQISKMEADYELILIIY